MRTPGTPHELERRRHLAVQRVHDGWPQATVAAVLGVHPRTLQRWLASYRARGAAGLQPRPHPGAAPKLPRRKQGLVLGWLRKNPKSFGFPTELWTAKRVAQLIERTFGIRYHPRYLNAWLTAWGFSPQQPRRQPRERDEAGIARWLREDWSRIKKKRGAGGPTSS